MATFKHQPTSSPKLVSAYRGKTIVFLEGETDVNLFRNYWFKHRLDKLEFTEPQDGIGCIGVVQNVREYRKQGIPAFGIVDRDKLQADKQWDLVWETNDERFADAEPYGQHVRVTRYWEIESYLVHPEAIEEHLCHCTGGRSPQPAASAEQECLDHAEALIPHAAMNGARRTHGLRELDDGQTSKFPDRVGVEQEFARLHETGDVTPEVWETYQAYLPKVEAFTAGSTVSEQLAGLLRRVNGKALIHRISKKYKLSGDHTFLLAEAIRQKNAVPQELTRYVDAFCSFGEAA